MINLRKLFFIAPIKTIWFNFRFLPIKQAYKLPVFLSRNLVVITCHKGFCEFRDGVKTGILQFGLGDLNYNVKYKGRLSIKGKMIINGRNFHSFGVGVNISVGSKGVLTLGDNFSASANNRIACSCAITIGDDNMWSFDNVIMDSDTHQICDGQGDVLNYNKPIIFGNHVWLGCRSIIMKGSEIADGCMIASGSKISGKYEEKNCILTSNKKIIKHNIYWKRDWAINKQ